MVGFQPQGQLHTCHMRSTSIPTSCRSTQHVDVGVCCHASLRSLGFDKARELGRIGLRLDARTSLPDDLMLLNTRLQGKVERLAVRCAGGDGGSAYKWCGEWRGPRM